jgi:F0F1-type ATP synthase membrane subunit b/b'
MGTMNNGKQTLAIILSFAVMMFAVLGLMWSSLEGRMAMCEQQVSKEVGLSAAQRATVDLRLAHIEKQVEEIRQDVKALRGRGGD